MLGKLSCQNPVGIPKTVCFVCLLQPPGGMLKRQKTVVDINLSDSMKEEVFQQLIEQQTTINKRRSSEQKKSQEEVRGRCHNECGHS